MADRPIYVPTEAEIEAVRATATDVLDAMDKKGTAHCFGKLFDFQEAMRPEIALWLLSELAAAKARVVELERELEAEKATNMTSGLKHAKDAMERAWECRCDSYDPWPDNGEENDPHDSPHDATAVHVYGLLQGALDDAIEEFRVSQSAIAACENRCEHCALPAPEGKRFCSEACLRCEHESKNENIGCDGICLGEVERA